MTLDEVKTFQAWNGLGNVHVIHIDAFGWRIAHTNDERKRVEAEGKPLEDCPVHAHLKETGYGEYKRGLYFAVPGFYSDVRLVPLLVHITEYVDEVPCSDHINEPAVVPDMWDDIEIPAGAF